MWPEPRLTELRRERRRRAEIAAADSIDVSADGKTIRRLRLFHDPQLGCPALCDA